MNKSENGNAKRNLKLQRKKEIRRNAVLKRWQKQKTSDVDVQLENNDVLNVIILSEQIVESFHAVSNKDFLRRKNTKNETLKLLYVAQQSALRNYLNFKLK